MFSKLLIKDDDDDDVDDDDDDDVDDDDCRRWNDVSGHSKVTSLLIKCSWLAGV